jgi:alpha-1,3-rhamnosyl/mannosyltransferase
VTARRLRIGVDGRAFASPAGGVRRYVWELYAAMARSGGVDVVAIGAGAVPAGVTALPASSLPTNLGWMGVSLPLAARRASVDVFHAPDYKAPLWGVHPQVVTIHDVSYARVPEWNAYRDDPARRYFYRRGALAADRVITDSDFSRAEITAAYAIPPDRIDVVPLAAAAALTPGSCDAARLPAGVQPPYALHVGDLQTRRNLATALEAMLGVRRAGQRVTLVCAGVDRGVAGSLRERAAAAGDSSAIVFTGPVDDDALLHLYRGAEMLLYPSRYEGFGLPVLEAMQCGVPVVASRAASIPEVLGDAGLLLDPLDAAAWQTAIARVLTEPGLAGGMRDAGVERAAAFSWKRTADETLGVLRRAAATRTS